MDTNNNYNFQVNLKGMIDLLSHNLYSNPGVFVRELLQNGVDAITARQALEPDFQGSLRFTLHGEGVGATLVLEDDGVGLTMDEIHGFLSTIGQSSKRENLAEMQTDFLGKFGIGILACFMVADEIVLLTRSVRAEGQSIEWRGREDGTYQIRLLDKELEKGTQIFLRCKEEAREMFSPERILKLMKHYGGLLSCPVFFGDGTAEKQINESIPPWDRAPVSVEQTREVYLEWGEKLLEERFLDYIPLEAKSGGVRGAAYILNHSASLAARRNHRVYLRGMLLTEKAQNLLPDWAFFVRCIVNAQDLNPTASREEFYEDEKLEQAIAELGRSLRDYLLELSRSHPEKLQAIIAVHHLSIRSLAVEDDDCFKVFINWLPFETTLGDLTLAEMLEKYDTIQYIPNLEQFRKVAGIAAAQSICVVNGGYTFSIELLEQAARILDDVHVEKIDASHLSEGFEELSLEEREDVFDFIRFAEVVLQEYKTKVEVRKFQPDNLPALYTSNEAAVFQRSIEKAQEITDELFASIMDSISLDVARQARNEICFNYNNPVIRSMTKLEDRERLKSLIEILYAQSLLLGHYNLSAKEMGLMNHGLMDLIGWGLEGLK